MSEKEWICEYFWYVDTRCGSQVWLLPNNWADYNNSINISSHLRWSHPLIYLFYLSKLLFLSLDYIGMLRVQFRPLTFNCINLVPILWKWLHVTLAPTSLLEIDSFLWNSFQIEWVYFDPYYYKDQRFWKRQNLYYFLWLIFSGNKVNIELSLELKQLNWHNQ